MKTLEREQKALVNTESNAELMRACGLPRGEIQYRTRGRRNVERPDIRRSY
jgi:hypothetical protein